jgi:hypothetical protein
VPAPWPTSNDRFGETQLNDFAAIGLFCSLLGCGDPPGSAADHGISR